MKVEASQEHSICLGTLEVAAHNTVLERPAVLGSCCDPGQEQQGCGVVCPAVTLGLAGTIWPGWAGLGCSRWILEGNVPPDPLLYSRETKPNAKTPRRGEGFPLLTMVSRLRQHRREELMTLLSLQEKSVYDRERD